MGSGCHQRISYLLGPSASQFSSGFATAVANVNIAINAIDVTGNNANPWDLLQPQDAMSRHRGAKPLRRCELLGVISLLSPG